MGSRDRKEGQEFKASQLQLYSESEASLGDCHKQKTKQKKEEKKEYLLKTFGWPVGMWGRSMRK